MYKSRPKSREVVPYLNAAEPFDTLPRLLIPTRAFPYKPPVLGYGWRAPRAALFEYARQRKLHQRRSGEVDELASIMHAFPTFVREHWPSLHEHYIKLEWSSIGPADTNHVLVIVYTNFDLKRVDLPSSEEIESIGNVLGVEDRPGWFLIDEQCWGWRLWSEK
ncbi:hypothetical protein DAEQUDRAFT_733658 [Daedalea quercina L-15889]|uniref:Uncharacterized protein n=1 Tax=Daedalea quercina L-15889 TaxID=1314783 RepID=A0A165KUA2_9APHY|nr:hypothetical protein DAEQUDRAFT_733658 [Daedalea quercina L-15889]